MIVKTKIQIKILNFKYRVSFFKTSNLKLWNVFWRCSYGNKEKTQWLWHVLCPLFSLDFKHVRLTAVLSFVRLSDAINIKACFLSAKICWFTIIFFPVVVTLDVVATNKVYWGILSSACLPLLPFNKSYCQTFAPKVR